jgi:hypothetical protein
LVVSRNTLVQFAGTNLCLPLRHLGIELGPCFRRDLRPRSVFTQQDVGGGHERIAGNTQITVAEAGEIQPAQPVARLSITGR